MSKILSIVSLLLLLPGLAAAQLPSEPVRLFDGRVRLGAEITATIGADDDEAFFNYTDYERNTLRTFRAALSAIWQPARRLALLGEVRSDDLEPIGAYAAYVRVRPWSRLPLDVQAGRIPPVFGAFGRRAYQSDRILIGYPLAYQYLASIRSDALPATADDLLRMRGRGWQSTFPVGASYPAPGLPLISAFRWDTGVQARWSAAPIDAAISVTNGTLSRPLVGDDNGGKQVAGRVAVTPLPGLIAGMSAAHGEWIADEAGVDTDDTQQAFGADLEYSRGHWLLRSELVWSRWGMPFSEAPPEGRTLRAVGGWIEGRYRVTPRLHLAGRLDRLTFSDVTGTLFDGQPTPCDAPVTRLELGGGYAVWRNLVLRTSVQANRRSGGRIERRTYFSTQVAWWF